MKISTRVEFGDFQTPLELARDVCARLVRQGLAPDVIVEPTCGTGAFLVAAAEAFPDSRLYGWDVNPVYVRKARAGLAPIGAADRAFVRPGNFFDRDWTKAISDTTAAGQSVLVLGNPPWVTNAALSVVNGSNLPTKQNLQGLRGLEARTGKSNFDISEWMLLRLLEALGSIGPGRGTIAMLCKTATAYKLLRASGQQVSWGLDRPSFSRIDARSHFGAAVDACLFLSRIGPGRSRQAAVYDSLTARRPARTIGLAGTELIADLTAYRRLRHLEGGCPGQWRSGVKHDCAGIMELRPTSDGRWRNKLGEQLALESNHVFPLLKCSDLANGRLTPERAIVIPQRRLEEETGSLERTAPQTWRYLQSHRERLAARRSSIYRSRAPFALFGIGDYSFAPWKVAVSGLHATARFGVVGPHEGKPVLFDDTCYFLPFSSEAGARSTAAVLDSEPCRRFLNALIFPQTKRPVTVELLQRLDLWAIAKAAGLRLESDWNAAPGRGVRSNRRSATVRSRARPAPAL